jgi:trigger factor
MGMIRKMYGPAVLSEIIDQEINKAMTDYMVEHKLSFLGNPMPSEDQEQQDIDPSNLQDFEFSFDLGLVPQFDLVEVDEKTKFPQYEVKVEKAKIDEEIENMLTRLGSQEVVEDKVADGDILRVTAAELDGRKLKEDGFHCHFSIAVADLAKDAAKKVMGKEAGASFNFNIYELDTKLTRDLVIKQLLQIPEEEAEVIGEKFRITIDEVLRAQPAEMSEEILTQYFGPGKVSNEEEAREFIENDLKKFYGSQADAVLFKIIQKHLMEAHADLTPLPDAFLKRWLRSRNSQEDITDEQLEQDYPLFAEDLRWRLIKEKLLEKYEVKIEEEDIRQGFRNRFLQYFGGSMDNQALIEQMVDRAMESQEQIEAVQQEVITEKLFGVLKENMPLQKKSITLKKFEEIQKEHLPQRTA